MPGACDSDGGTHTPWPSAHPAAQSPPLRTQVSSYLEDIVPRSPTSVLSSLVFRLFYFI